MIPRLTVVFIFVFGIQEICSSQNFSGQVFLLSKEFIEDKCEVNAGCDCCGTDLFFLSKTKFGFVSRCLSGDTYFTGTYSLKANTLRLNFNKKYLSEVVSDDYQLIRCEVKKTKIKKIEFDIKKCGQKFRLTHATTADWKNGSRYPPTEEGASLKKLLASKQWKQLTN